MDDRDSANVHLQLYPIGHHPGYGSPHSSFIITTVIVYCFTNQTRWNVIVASVLWSAVITSTIGEGGNDLAIAVVATKRWNIVQIAIGLLIHVYITMVAH